jgi:mono/diheme cytochrome c family protein
MRTILTTFTLAALTATAVSAADAKAGQAVYNTSCKSCHGPDGAGNPSVAKMMKVEMKDLKSADVQILSDADIKNIISAGKGKMRPITAVSGGALDNVVAYLRSLKN